MSKFPVVLMAAAALAAPETSMAQGLPDAPGKATYEAICGGCHGADIVIGSQRSRAAWEETVESMKNRGAFGSENEFKTVTDYLVANFGPTQPTAAGGPAPAKPAAAGTTAAAAATAPAKSSPGFWIIFMPWRWF